MIPQIKLSRLEVTDTSVILQDKTRPKQDKSVTHQLDMRTRRQIVRDDEITKYIGEETRKGFQHNKKHAIKLRKQATWRAKRRRQIREWEEASRREERENAVTSNDKPAPSEKPRKTTTRTHSGPRQQHRPTSAEHHTCPRQKHLAPRPSEDGDAPRATETHPTALGVSTDGGIMQQQTVAKVPRQKGKRERRASEGGDSHKRSKVRVTKDQKVKIKIRVEGGPGESREVKGVVAGDAEGGQKSNLTQPDCKYAKVVGVTRTEPFEEPTQRQKPSGHRKRPPKPNGQKERRTKPTEPRERRTERATSRKDPTRPTKLENTEQRCQRRTF